jgi:hypothetical protein
MDDLLCDEHFRQERETNVIGIAQSEITPLAGEPQ